MRGFDLADEVFDAAREFAICANDYVMN